MAAAFDLDPPFPSPACAAACAPPAAPLDPYDALLARLRGERVPYHVLWELTHACNLRCVMCYNVPRDEPELSTAECLDVLEQLAEAGTLRLGLTGGEILARPDFFTIAERARALGFALDLKTNGTLITPAVADRIAALAPVQVDISLLGATPATSDAVMGGRGTLPRIRRAARLLAERGVRVQLNALLLDMNVAERQQILDLAADLRVYCQQTFKVSPADDGSNAAARHQITLTQMAAALAADRTPLRPLDRTPSGRTCGVGLSSCLISPYGTIYPCVELRIPAGDLRQQRFVDIWARAPILVALRDRHIVGNLPECRACPLLAVCEGRCAGLAWRESGDPYLGHALACRHAQARHALQHPGEPLVQTPTQARLAAGLTSDRAARSSHRSPDQGT